MTVSMRVMSAGDGYKYLLKTVAAADGDRPLSTPLTRYYMEEGTPPGRWLGAGVAALGKGEIQVGDRLSEDQLQLLMGTGCDPITGDKLGLGFPTYTSQAQRIEARIAGLESTMTPGAKGEAVAQIVAEERAEVRGVLWRASTSPSRFRSQHRCCGQSPTPGSRHSSGKRIIERLRR